MPTSTTSNGTASLTKEVKELRAAVDIARRAFQRSDQVRRTLAISFLKGVTSALGALAVVAIVTPFIITVLQSIAWPPLLGEFVAKVILQYEQVSRQAPREVDGQ